MFLMPNDIYMTIPRGAKATTHIIGPVYKVTPKLVRPTISPVGPVTAVAWNNMYATKPVRAKPDAM